MKKIILFSLAALLILNITRNADLRAAEPDPKLFKAFMTNGLNEVCDSCGLWQLQPASTLLFLESHELQPNSAVSIYQGGHLIASIDKIDTRAPWVIVNLKKKSAAAHPSFTDGHVEVTALKLGGGTIQLKVVNLDSPIDSIEVNWPNRYVALSTLTSALHNTFAYMGTLAEAADLKPVSVINP